MKSPLIIIIELLAGLLNNAVSSIVLIVEKLAELVGSLLFISSLGIFGVIIAVVIGAVVFIFVSKVFFKTWKSVFGFVIAFAAVIFVLLLISMI